MVLSGSLKNLFPTLTSILDGTPSFTIRGRMLECARDVTCHSVLWKRVSRFFELTAMVFHDKIKKTLTIETFLRSSMVLAVCSHISVLSYVCMTLSSVRICDFMDKMSLPRYPKYVWLDVT